MESFKSDPALSPPSPPSATRVTPHNRVKGRGAFVRVEERKGPLKNYYGMWATSEILGGEVMPASRGSGLERGVGPDWGGGHRVLA